MNHFFDQNGHLTTEGLQILITGEPNELERLEIAEHLSFCDSCLEHYMALLEDDSLLEPPKRLTENIFQRLRRRAVTIFFNRYVAAAAAAVFAILFWGLGVFQPSTPNHSGIADVTASISQGTAYFTDQISQQVSRFTEHIQLKGAFDDEKK